MMHSQEILATCSMSRKMAGNLLVIFSMFHMLLYMYILTVIVSSCFLSNYDIPKMHYEGPDICVESHFQGDETETERAPTWTNGRHSPLSPLRRIEMAVAATVTPPAPAPAEAGAVIVVLIFWLARVAGIHE